jgi:hypothetical protein
MSEPMDGVPLWVYAAGAVTVVILLGVAHYVL